MPRRVAVGLAAIAAPSDARFGQRSSRAAVDGLVHHDSPDGHLPPRPQPAPFKASAIYCASSACCSSGVRCSFMEGNYKRCRANNRRATRQSRRFPIIAAECGILCVAFAAQRRQPDDAEACPSGLKEAVLKTVVPKGTVGSNPTASARTSRPDSLGPFSSRHLSVTKTRPSSTFMDLYRHSKSLLRS